MTDNDDTGIVQLGELYSTAPPWAAGWTPRGVIAALEPLTLPARQARIRMVIEQRLSSVTLVMDEPHDPHNGAALVRSADAFGVQQVHVVPQEERFTVSTGVARGSERWVDVIVHPSAAEAARHLDALGFTLVSTHPEGELLPQQLAQVERVALVFGNEHHGIGEELALAAPLSVRVPMRGFAESLNVSVSAGILLEAATRGRPGDLPLADRERLYARGLFRSVHRAGEILAASEPS